jgi:hypothetical protein
MTHLASTRSMFKRAAVLSCAMACAPAMASSQDEAQWVHTTPAPDGAMTDWSLYRNTLVSLDDAGTATCLLPPGRGDAAAGCHQVPDSDREFLSKLIDDHAGAGQMLTCGSDDYVGAWGPVPSAATFATHWCNAFPKEALTVRAHIDGSALVETKGVLTWNLASPRSLGTSTLAFVIPEQTDASGPMFPLVSGAGTSSRVTARVADAATGQSTDVVLIAVKQAGCDEPLAMNSTIRCAGHAQFEIAFDPEHNTHLPVGHFKGAFAVNPVNWSTFQQYEHLIIRVDIIKQ